MITLNDEDYYCHSNENSFFFKSNIANLVEEIFQVEVIPQRYR